MEGNPLVRIDSGLLIWTILTFLALLAVLRWKAWGPIVSAIERREKAIREAIDLARKDREEAQRTLAEQHRLVEQTRRETAAMIDQGRKDAESVRAEMIKKARHDAAEVVEQGRRQIERDTRAAVQELRSQAANLAVLAASRIVKVSLDEAGQKKIVEECLDEISDLPRH